MKETIMFASKDNCNFSKFYDDPKFVKFAGGKYIVKVLVREMQENEESPYYAYYDNNDLKFKFVYSGENLTRMCSPDYFHHQERNGYGKVMNVVVKEIEEWKGG